MNSGSTKWIVIACSTGIYIGIDKCSRLPISPGPGEIPPPPPPPLSGPVAGIGSVTGPIILQDCIHACMYVSCPLPQCSDTALVL